MPTYKVTAPDGRKLKLTGDNPPTKESLDEIFSKLPIKSAFDNAKPIDEVKGGKEIVDNQNKIANQIFGSDITAGMKSQGPIGFFEAITREDSLTKFTPFLNLYDANKDRVINNNIQRYVNGEKLTDSEMVDVTNKVYKDVESSVRGYNWKGKIAYGLASSSSFMAEFALGGYLLKGLGLVAKGGQAINTGGKIAKAVSVGTSIAKESALRTVVMPNRILDSYNQRKINQMIAITDKGQVLLKDIKEKPSLTLLKSFGDVFVENYTERLGDVLLSPIFNKTGKIFKRAVPKRLLDGLEKLTPEVTNMPFNKAIKSMGWDGLLEEIGEERLGDLMRSSLGLNDEEYNFENIAKSIIPDYEDFMVEAGVISITGGTMRGAQILSNKLISNGVGSNKAKGIISNMTPLEIDETLKNPPISVEAKEIEQSYIQERNTLIDKMINAGINEEDSRAVQKAIDQRVLALSEAINVPASDIVKSWGLDIVKSTNEQEETERVKRIYTLVREEGYTPEEAEIEAEKDVLKQDDISIKQKQLDIINKYNPAPNEYNTWVRKIEDIKTLEEAYADENNIVTNPDFENEDIENAIKLGSITVYSSYPIKKGTFISPSYMEAEQYAGNGKVYSKNVKLSDIAWIDTIEGQYAPVKAKILKQDDIEIPTINSEGNPIAKDKQGLDNFNNWFKDSKVVDEAGNPLVVYHGTETEFNEFKKKEIGANTGNYGHTGYGFYFSTSVKEAEGYGDNLIKAYINIKKPFRGSDEEIKRYAKELDIEPDIEIVDKDDLLNAIKNVDIKAYNLAKLLIKYDYDTAWDKFLEKNNIYDNVLDLNMVADWVQSISDNNFPEYILNQIKEQFDSIKTKKEYSTINSLPYLLDLGQYKSKNINFTNALKRDGYDGVIYGSEIVAFEPNQIKSVENIGEFSKETGDIYKQDSRGQIEFTPDKTTIKLMEKADRSTILHEFGHLFLRDIISYSTLIPENNRLKKEIKSIRDFVGNNGEEFTREQEETFARGFEAYLKEGKAPIPELQNAFDKFKVWLQSIYSSMKELNVKMNKKSIDMFEDLFLTQKQLTDKKENRKKAFIENISNIQLSLEKIEGNEVGEVKKIIDKMLKSDIDIDIDVNESEKIKINLLSAIRQYRKTLKMKKGRQGQTVAEFLRNNKGFKISRKFVEHGLQRKGEFEALKIPTYVNKPTMGEIWVTQEDTLMQLLKDEGFITETTELSDTDVLDELLYNAETTRKVTDDSLTREIYDESVDVADRGLYEISRQLELGIGAEQFLDIINTLKKKGFNVVEMQDLNSIYKEFKQSKNKQKDIEKQNIDNLANAKSKLNSYFTNMNLSFKDKADLFKKVSEIKDISQYNQRVTKILNYANELLEDNLKDRQTKFIKDILKSYSVKTDKQGIKRSKLDVGTQKILNDLIEINSLDINQAGDIYLNIGKDEIYSDYELLKNKMITYRFKGFDSPASLLQSLSNDLNKLVEYGKTAKTEKDALNRLNRINEVIDFNQGINHIKADVDTVKTKIANTYRTGFTNIYSALNSVAGKKIADEYGNKLEFGFSKMFTDNYKQDKRANKEIAKILDVKENQIAETLIDYGKEDYKLVSKKGVTYKLNKMMIIDIYNAIKQKNIRGDYFENYNKDDILALIGNLTDKDKALGDYLAKEVQDYYDIMNDAVVDIYGTALPKVKNYWSSSVENVKDVNLVLQFELTSQLPSALKSRMGSRVPVPSNAWNKYTSYVTQANYMKNVGREFRNISLLLNDSSVTRNIVNKFGENVKENIDNLMEGMSLNGIKNIESSLSGIVNTVLNNWVTAKIGLNPSVFVKQLGSVTNYAENMPVKEWGKLFLEGLSKPKETIRFMFDNVEYLQARFSKGYSEEISRAIATASKLSANKQSLTNVMTSLTRLGDIGAIIFGGYPKLKYELKQGKSMAEAVDSFVLETIKSQQSGLQSSLSVAQQSKNGFMRMLFAFKNTPAQYMRKIADTILQYQNGDISKEQMQKSLVNYLVVQPAIYSWIGSLMVGRFFDDDEEFASFKDLMATLLSQPFSAIPFLDDISKYLASGVVGNKQWKVFNNSFLADIENTLRKAKKEDITIEDLVDIIGTGAELSVGIPVKTVNRLIKRMTGEYE